MSLKANKFKIIVIILLAIFFVNSSFAQSNAELKSTVEKFYKYHRSRSGLVSTHELNLLKGWFTGNLTNLFRNEIKREDVFVKNNPSEKPRFGDGFPFQPFEECVIENKIFPNRLEIGEIKNELNKAIVQVKFYIPKECEDQVDEKLIDIYRIELFKTKTRWLINDWIYTDDSRLTDVLKRKVY